MRGNGFRDDGVPSGRSPSSLARWARARPGLRSDPFSSVRSVESVSPARAPASPSGASRAANRPAVIPRLRIAVTRARAAAARVAILRYDHRSSQRDLYAPGPAENPYTAAAPGQVDPEAH